MTGPKADQKPPDERQATTTWSFILRVVLKAAALFLLLNLLFIAV